MGEAGARDRALARHTGKVATGAVRLDLSCALGDEPTAGKEPGPTLPFPFPFAYSAGTSRAREGSAPAGARPWSDTARNCSNSATGSGRLTQ